MLITKKMLLALTLVGALVGAGIGALATRTTQSTSAANTNYDTTKPVPLPFGLRKVWTRGKMVMGEN